MSRMSLSNLLRLAAKFERLAQMPAPDDGVTIPQSLVRFHKAFKELLNKDVPVADLSNWIQANATVLGNRVNSAWFVNYNDDLECQLDSSNNTRRSAIITKVPKEVEKNSEYDIIQSGILQGSGSIPSLTLFIVNYNYGRRVSDMPKELAHNSFIYEALSEMFSEVSKEDALEFYLTNKKKVDKIRAMFQSNPQRLGGGADGVAFSIGSDKILKLFRDKFSYEKALKAVDRLHKYPELAKTEAMIYDIGVLGEYQDRPVYYYVMERMKTVRSLDQSSQDSVTTIAREVAAIIKKVKASQLKSLKLQIEDPDKHKAIKEAVKTFSQNIAGQLNVYLKSHIDNLENNLDLKRGWLETFIEELIMKYLTSRTDLHMGNLGVTQQGELRYFDPAYSDWVSNLNL